MTAERTNPFSSLLPLVEREIGKCIRCGECRCVCPVFREQYTERYTARGRLQILHALAKGELEPSKSVREALDNCLVCTGCAAICGSGVRLEQAMLAARAIFAKEKGMPLVKRILVTVLAQPAPLLAVESRLGRYAQKLACLKVPETSGLYLRFAVSVADRKQYVPELAETPFRSRYIYRPSANGPKVVFFTGCLMNYAMTGIAESLVTVCNAVGVDVIVPANQACCGTPMAMSGDLDALARQAARNAEALEGPEEHTIVTACASCGHMLKHGYADNLGDASLREKFRKIGARTMDITEYLATVIGLERLGNALRFPTGETVTYHDPCHLRKAQNVTDAPRRLLAAATGRPVREMDSPEACCGLGGTYCLGNMALSKKIQTRKILDIIGTEASSVSTVCPGCIIQLADGLRRHRSAPVQVKHLLEILADAVRGESENAGPYRLRSGHNAV